MIDLALREDCMAIHHDAGLMQEAALPHCDCKPVCLFHDRATVALANHHNMDLTGELVLPDCEVAYLLHNLARVAVVKCHSTGLIGELSLPDSKAVYLLQNLAKAA